MNKAPSLLSLILVLVALAVFGVVGAKFMLNRHTTTTMSQLGTVWPDPDFPRTHTLKVKKHEVLAALQQHDAARPAGRS